MCTANGEFAFNQLMNTLRILKYSDMSKSELHMLFVFLMLQYHAVHGDTEFLSVEEDRKRHSAETTT